VKRDFSTAFLRGLIGCCLLSGLALICLALFDH